MIRFDPNTSSEILRSTHILELTILVSTMGDWTQAGRYQARTVDMTIRLDRVLKGVVDQAAGATIPLRVRQFSPAGGFIISVPSAWSTQTLEPGAYVAFCIAEGEHLPDVLDDARCKHLFLADQALPDAELVLIAGIPEMPLATLLGRTADRKASYGRLFAGYVAARLPEILFSNWTDFNSIMRVLEDPNLSNIAREILIVEMYVKMIMLEPAPPRFVARLIEGTIRIIALPGMEGVARDVLETYLPSLLGIERAAGPLESNAVFADNPALRAEAATAFKALGGPGILKWLHA